jgi:hypothetical protein
MTVAAAQIHRFSLSGLLYGAVAGVAIGFIAYLTLFNVG